MRSKCDKIECLLSDYIDGTLSERQNSRCRIASSAPVGLCQTRSRRPEEKAHHLLEKLLR